MAKRYFEDLVEGERLPCRPVVMTHEAITAFGREFDPLPFHVDDEAGRASIFGSVIASSLHTLSACTRAVVEAQGDVAILSGLALEEAKLTTAVRPGDTLFVDARWAHLRRSRSKPHLAVATIRCTVTNQKGEVVTEYGYRYMLACRLAVP